MLMILFYKKNPFINASSHDINKVVFDSTFINLLILVYISVYLISKNLVLLR